MNSPTVAVIGGGISGLSSAFRLGQLGHEVTLFESEDFLGGLGTTFPYRDGHLERFYHCILPQDTSLIALLSEMGISALTLRAAERWWRSAGQRLRVECFSARYSQIESESQTASPPSSRQGTLPDGEYLRIAAFDSGV